LIGSIIGLLALSLLGLCCCRYCWFVSFNTFFSLQTLDQIRLLGRRSYGFNNEESIKLYHIERCTDLNCVSIDEITPSDIFSMPQKNYLIYQASDQSTISSPPSGRVLSSSLSNRRDVMLKDRDESQMIDIRPGSFLSMVEDHERCQSSSGVSVQKVKLVDRTSPARSMRIKTPNRICTDEAYGTPVDNFTNGGNVKVARIKSTTEPRIFGANRHLHKIVDNGQSEEARPKSKTPQRVTTIRLGSLLPKGQTQLGVNHQPICADDIDTTGESCCLSPNQKKDQVTVTRVRSVHRPKEFNQLSSSPTGRSDQLSTVSPSITSISPISTAIDCSSVDTDRSKSIEQTVKKKTPSKGHANSLVQSSCTVERIPRTNTVNSTKNTKGTIPISFTTYV
jgi:hypothetical protein